MGSCRLIGPKFASFKNFIPECVSRNGNEGDQRIQSLIQILSRMPGKILIVEDQVDHRLILALMLSRMSYQVIEAVDGQEGIDKAMTEAPDLIIMDLGLPGIDGIETAMRLKRNPKTAPIPVIAHTIWTEREHKNRALEAGMVGYLTKPTAPQVFKEAITRALQTRS